MAINIFDTETPTIEQALELANSFRVVEYEDESTKFKKLVFNCIMELPSMRKYMTMPIITLRMLSDKLNLKTDGYASDESIKEIFFSIDIKYELNTIMAVYQLLPDREYY